MRDAEEICRTIYRETADFYAARRALISPNDLGFRVLYGPPIVGAPILFIGYQPGGRAIEDVAHQSGWPEACEYARASWLLARRMRDLWGADLVARCTGLNAIFFRATTAEAWKRCNRAAVAEAEAFSIERVKRIATVLKPQRIVLIGLATFDLLTEGHVALCDGARVLAKQGTLCGCRATGIIHLSGAWISRAQLDQLRAFIRDDAG